METAKRYNRAAYNRKSRYGVTEEKYQELLTTQDNSCAVCKASFDEVKPCIDHDHNCCPGSKSCGKCVRGILCPSCLTLASLMETKFKYSNDLFNYLYMHLIKRMEVN